MESRHIVDLRLRLGLSQERFARRLGVSLQTVRRWESGLNRPLPIISVKLEELVREAGIEQGNHQGGSTMRGGSRQGKATLEIGFGDLFKGVGNLVDLVSKLAEEGREETSSSGEFEAMGGKVKGVYGLSVRVGLGGKPVIQAFGNIQDTDKGPVVAETREPLVDVLDEEDHLMVVAEIPGVEEKDIQATVEGDILVIVASSQDRKYQKEVLLPSPVDPASLTSSYRNGVLEVKLSKR